MSGNKGSPWEQASSPSSAPSRSYKKIIIAIIAIILIASALTIGLPRILDPPRSSIPGHNSILNPYAFYLTYSQAKKTFLQGFINSSSPDYVINASILKSQNYSSFVVYGNFFLVLPLSNVSSYSQKLFSSQIGGNATFLKLNLTQISNTGLEIAQAQGVKNTNTYFEIVFGLSAISPRSQNQVSLYNQTVGEMGFTQNYGDYVSFKAESLSIPLNFTVNI